MIWYIITAMMLSINSSIGLLLQRGVLQRGSHRVFPSYCSAPTKPHSVEGEQIAIDTTRRKITEIGDYIRNEKAQGATKLSLDSQIAELLNLKESYQKMTGIPFVSKYPSRKKSTSEIDAATISGKCNNMLKSQATITVAEMMQSIKLKALVVKEGLDEQIEESVDRSCFKGLASTARPTLDDVERISYGQGAKKRGTGSRQVPHRLNGDERSEWDIAKSRGFLLLRGSGYRKERGDSPLANSYRQYCDAKGIPCITIKRGLGVDAHDTVTIDLSPLRAPSNTAAALASSLRQICTEVLLTENRFSSCKIEEIKDFADVSSLGWECELDSLSDRPEPIWRLPVFGISVFFTDRKEAKDFATLLSVEIIYSG